MASYICPRCRNRLVIAASTSKKKSIKCPKCKTLMKRLINY